MGAISVNLAGIREAHPEIFVSFARSMIWSCGSIVSALWNSGADFYQFQSTLIEPREGTKLGVPVGAASCILLRPSVGNLCSLVADGLLQLQSGQ